MSPQIHEQRIRLNQFPSTHLTISQSDIVEYFICPADSPNVKLPKQPRKFYFIFQIKQLHIKTGRLYALDSFQVTFNTPGLYFVQCLNVPSMTQEIKVEQPSTVHNTSQSLCDKSTQYLEEDTTSWRDANDAPLTKRKILCSEFNFQKPKKDGKSDVLKTDQRVEMSVDLQLANTIFMDSEIDKTYLSEYQNIDISTEQAQHEQPSMFLAEKMGDDRQFMSVHGDEDTLCCLPDLKEEILEHIHFSQLDFDKVTEMLTHLQNKYGQTIERGQKNSAVFGSIQELSTEVVRHLKSDFEQLKFPKGLSNRKLRRANQKIEARF